ncbi:hypothetical protein [Levyella massiliensis]|uniref:hypothetical protein n=1 Tax=Levyella massiliensis TaxID=938289 RepID=UPI0023F516F4|nr:hypothetical protein [Levyella massiliensis]
MKKTYRIVALLFVLALLPLLSSCNKDSGEGKKAVETSEKSQNAVYQTKLLSVEVPKGWKFVDQPNKADSAYIYKGEKEAMESPAVVITYCDPDTQMLSPRAAYQNTKDIDPVTIGDYTWEGFTAESFDYPITVLLLKEPHQLQVVLFKEVEGQKINLEDDDVQTIIRSITIK